jgi:hypothetical protein
MLLAGFIGFLIGGILGIFLMCLCQINKDNDME